MKNPIYLLILALSFGCAGQSESSSSKAINPSQANIVSSQKSVTNKKKIQTLAQLTKAEASDTYKITKRKIEVHKNQINQDHLPIDSVSKVFEESLLNKIIPFWEGTEWSFEGHTSKPKSGTVLCINDITRRRTKCK